MECKTFNALWLTDIDGTLIPSNNASPLVFSRISSFLKVLENYCVLTVPVTFKTRAELKELSRTLNYSFKAYVAEGGCSIIISQTLANPYQWKAGDGEEVITLCRNRSVLNVVFHSVDNTSCRDRYVRLTSLTPREASELLNASLKEAENAVKREFTEVVYSGSSECQQLIEKEAVSHGFKAFRTHRFLHLGEAGKEEAVKLLLNLIGYRVKGLTISSGDSPADAEFLRLAETSIIVSNSHTEWFRKYPYVKITNNIPHSLIDIISRHLLLKQPFE
ncbi:MAG: HAD hydrolase family protein [Thermosphaera aggregans]|jgi:HAD superfamily hydrolase (TIGR01484 family)|uniref:HAD hydrolase family protein n=1 Tax=Thermosphaera aggregans TaxID=54254 RepID=UPI003C04579B